MTHTATTSDNIVARHQSSEELPTVDIMCDMDEAKQLLEAARRVYPEAVPFIEDAMSVAPEVWTRRFSSAISHSSFPSYSEKS